MSHTVCKTSATNLDPRFKTNPATSVLSSSFGPLANADNSVYDFIFSATTIRHVQTKTFVFMVTVYVIFLPAILAAFFIAIRRVMSNRFRALTSG